VYAPKHSDDIPIPNLEVLAILKSFKSKGYVKETFNWQWYYCYLTNEGIDHLRQVLALPEDIVPATLKANGATGIRPEAEGRGEGKGKGAPGDFKPEYRKEGGGFGRGRDEYRRKQEA